MSRIGKLPVVLPANTKAELLDGNIVKVKGPNGELCQKVDPDITVTIEGNEIKFTRPSDLPVSAPCTASIAPLSTTWWWV